jgi:hypothetical protein
MLQIETDKQKKASHGQLGKQIASMQKKKFICEMLKKVSDLL